MLLGEVSIGNPQFDDALRDAATALVDEMILELEDLKDMRIDAWLRAGDRRGDERSRSPARPRLSWLQIVDGRGDGGRRRAGQSRRRRASGSCRSTRPRPSTTHSRIQSSAKGMLDHMERLAASRLWPTSAPRRPCSATGRSPCASAEHRGARGFVARRGSRGSRRRRARRAREAASLVRLHAGRRRRRTEPLRRLARQDARAVRRRHAAQEPGRKSTGSIPRKLPKVQSRRGPAKLAESRIYEIPVPAAIIAKSQGETTARSSDARRSDPDRHHDVPRGQTDAGSAFPLRAAARRAA